jgi:hypothetical protein
MIYKFLLLLSLFSLSQCRSVDPEIEPYIQDFKTEAKKFNIEVDDVELTAAKTTFANYKYDGYSIPNPFKPFIRVNTYWWDKYDSNTRRLLVFHECGHEFLGRLEHNNELTYEDWDPEHAYPLPKSIMNFQGISEWQYEAHKECYLYELFNNRYSDDPKCSIFKKKNI